MQNSLAKSVAQGLFIAVVAPYACSNGSHSSDGSGTSGGPATGGRATSALGGNAAMESTAANRSSAGVRATSPGGSSGGSVIGVGGKPSGGTEVPSSGNSSGGTGMLTSGIASGGTGGTTARSTITGGNSSRGGSNPATGGNTTRAGGSGAGRANTGGAELGGASSGIGGRSSAAGDTHVTGGAGTGDTTPAAGSATGPRSAGCGKTSSLTFTTVPGESGQNVGVGEGGYVKIQSGGQSRGFALRLPDNYDKNKPYWLIFGFHWNGGNSKEVDTGGSNGYSMAHFGLQKLSKNGAIFVAPDGLNAGWGGDNLPFVDDMVKLIEDNYCVDTAHLFTNGFSYGGGMSYAIACARAKVFRGAAIYEGAVLSGCAGGNDPIAYWQMAGTTDGTCTIDMATPMRDRFAKNNGCTLPATEPPRPKSISDAHICTDYTGCSSGHPLRWCVHPAGHGNAIVDGTSDLYNSCATPPKSCSTTCPCTWVPEDVWSFFKSL